MTKPPRMLISTVDNPYDPFKEWTRWRNEDARLGYDTLGLLARLAPPSSDIDKDSADEVAMRLLLQYNFSGKHIAVVPSDYSPLLTVAAF